MAEPAPRMGLFERWLTAWVALCIVVGTVLGYLFPAAFARLGTLEAARINLPVALLVWLMIVPMLMKVDFGAMRQVGRHWRGIGVTVFINWAVKPFSMALLGGFFLRHVFADWLPADQIDRAVGPTSEPERAVAPNSLATFTVLNLRTPRGALVITADHPVFVGLTVLGAAGASTSAAFPDYEYDGS